MKMSLQFKMALMFFFVMFVSSIISICALLIILRSVLAVDNKSQITMIVESMRSIASTEEFADSGIDEIASICNPGVAEIEKLDKSSAEYYRVKIDAAEYNCYVETSGLIPNSIGYAVINDTYIKITPSSKENIYSVIFFIITITMIVCIIIGSVITVFTSKGLLKPLRSLNAATTMVARGNFNVSVSESKDPEFATLVNNFNKMTAELSGIETLRGDFISNVSHEFKTPLSSIQGFAKLLQDETLSPQERREYTQIIISETGRLSKLTSDILKLSKLENQNTIVNKKRFSLDEQIRKILLVLEPEWTKKNVELDIELDDVFYFGNEELMAQIWQNVINNAIKFTPENGHIGVRLFRTETNISIKISDDGPQIPPEIANHIFDKFYQGDNSRKTEGNGLGLALVRRIVDLCGGKISVENLYEGGVCFNIELPYAISDMR